MTQEAIQLPTTPPLSGPDLVSKINNALLALGTDFAGAVDPAALAWAYCTWADTGNMLLKRRNAANSAWVVEGKLLVDNSSAANITVVPVGGVTATTLQNAIQQLDRRVLLATATASSSVASVALSWADINFHHYELVWDGVTLAAGGNALLMNMSADGGSSYITATHYNTFRASDTSGSSSFTGITSEGAIRLAGTGGLGVDGGTVLSGSLRTADRAFQTSSADSIFTSTNIHSMNGGYFVPNGAPINLLLIKTFTGLFVTGNFRIYGIR